MKGNRKTIISAMPCYSTLEQHSQLCWSSYTSVGYTDGASDDIEYLGRSHGVAMLLNAGAAFATVLGGLIICSHRTLRLATPMALATTLSISGGLMVFLSIVVSFGYSVMEFALAFQHETNGDELDGQTWLAATICQGVGIMVVYFVDFVVQKLTPSIDPETPKQVTHASEMGESIRGSIDDSVLLESPREQGIVRMDEKAKEKLQRMGILSGIAIALHNIPPGIATFTAGIEGLSIGLSMAIGVALHNIAEGVAVAAPVYFATGSKWKGIMWCVIAAIAEHVGAVIALVIIGVKDHDTAHFAQASLYGVISGMMATITMKEIFPTAYTYANGRIHLVSN
ncbi:Zinc (Zn2)-Iron (Fe2) Permease, partial [Phytophthora megakarya]